MPEKANEQHYEVPARFFELVLGPRLKYSSCLWEPGTRTLAMQQKLRAGGFEGPYRLRKQTVEPVFGQIKGARGFRRFLLRALAKVRGEWRLVCLTHNLLKLWRSGCRLAMS